MKLQQLNPFQRIQWLRSAGISEDQIVQPLCSKHSQLEQVAQDIPHVVLNVPVDGDVTTSLDNLFRCTVTFTVKHF